MILAMDVFVTGRERHLYMTSTKLQNCLYVNCYSHFIIAYFAQEFITKYFGTPLAFFFYIQYVFIHVFLLAFCFFLSNMNFKE